MINYLLVVFLLMAGGLVGCQSAPTRVKEDVGGEYDKTLVLVDTRSSLEFNSYHVSGSVHLSTSDYLVIQNPTLKVRKLDSDINQTIERLARKSISPAKKVILISNKKDSLENKKWQWLFKKLGVLNVQLTSLDEYRAANPSLAPRPEPEREEVWKIEKSKQKIILQESDLCFVSWNESKCNQ